MMGLGRGLAFLKLDFASVDELTGLENGININLCHDLVKVVALGELCILLINQPNAASIMCAQPHKGGEGYLFHSNTFCRN